MLKVYQLSATWCGHCPPAFQRANYFSAQTGIPVEMILIDKPLDNKEHKDLWDSEKEMTRAFPSYALVKDGNVVGRHTGGFRSLSEFESFLTTEYVPFVESSPFANNLKIVE